MANKKLETAKSRQYDEFYTQWADIEREVQAYLEFDPNVFRGKTVMCPCDDPEWSNFTKFFALHFHEYGLKKLISTSYAPQSKAYSYGYQPSLFESNDPKFDAAKTKVNGKLFVLESDGGAGRPVNIDDLKWDYMLGDGDFRSKEVSALQRDVDVIVTNPPFSLFREFFDWIVQAKKKFIIIGSILSLMYKEIFPLIKENAVWLGNGFRNGNAFFETPCKDNYTSDVIDSTSGLVKFRNCCWLTNIDHGRRHQPMNLMTMVDNLRFSKHKEVFGKPGYAKYVNYDAIEVPYCDAIPGDYFGKMGVPTSFLDKYCPEQFKIIGSSATLAGRPPDDVPKELRGGPRFYLRDGNGGYKRLVDRIVIQRVKGVLEGD